MLSRWGLGAVLGICMLSGGGYINDVANAKPHAPVNIDYQITKQAVNEPINIHLILENIVDVDDLIVSIKLGDGLQAVQLDAPYNFGIVPKHQKSHINFQVSAAGDGRYRIYVIASLVTGGKTQSRNMIVPLVVGAPPQVLTKPMGRIVTGSDGAAVISMPARRVSTPESGGQ